MIVLVETEHFCAAKDAAERQPLLGHRHLDGPHEALPANNLQHQDDSINVSVCLEGSESYDTNKTRGLFYAVKAC